MNKKSILVKLKNDVGYKKLNWMVQCSNMSPDNADEQNVLGGAKIRAFLQNTLIEMPPTR